jgi:hypothetical protein
MSLADPEVDAPSAANMPRSTHRGPGARGSSQIHVPGTVTSWFHNAARLHSGPGGARGQRQA